MFSLCSIGRTAGCVLLLLLPAASIAQDLLEGTYKMRLADEELPLELRVSPGFRGNIIICCSLCNGEMLHLQRLHVHIFLWILWTDTAAALLQCGVMRSIRLAICGFPNFFCCSVDRHFALFKQLIELSSFKLTCLNVISFGCIGCCTQGPGSGFEAQGKNKDLLFSGDVGDVGAHYFKNDHQETKSAYDCLEGCHKWNNKPNLFKCDAWNWSPGSCILIQRALLQRVFGKLFEGNVKSDKTFFGFCHPTARDRPSGKACKNAGLQ